MDMAINSPVWALTKNPWKNAAKPDAATPAQA
jgi:hypothetical protein